MRRGRTDGNHTEILEGLRAVPGVTAFSTAGVRDGFPDICCARLGVNYLLEIKDGSKPPSKRKLTEDEAKFHAMWTGQVAIVESVDDALRVIGVIE